VSEWKEKLPKLNIYFESKKGILYNADCLEIMKEILDKFFDWVITDPPYGVLQNQGWLGDKPRGQYKKRAYLDDGE